MVEERLFRVSNFLRAVKDLFATTGNCDATSATAFGLSKTFIFNSVQFDDFDIFGAA